ncbi:MAG: nucleotidyltransferase substrate binding protein [Chloroflexota bacterium]|nr:nucleotidyltransferase substrate binding protein [Chloroflexota bacterium]
MVSGHLDYGKFHLSLKSLAAQYEHLVRLPPDYPAYVHEGMAESVIQRFETCYDTLWKIVRRHLIEALGVVEVPNSPRPIFRIANENLLLADGERWQSYVQLRIDTSHDYDGEKAANAVARMPEFIADATALYSALTGEAWA